jgi:hypothetical protein
MDRDLSESLASDVIHLYNDVKERRPEVTPLEFTQALVKCAIKLLAGTIETNMKGG